MNAYQLRFYPRIHNVLSGANRRSLLDIAADLRIDKISTLLNVYSCFVDVTVKVSCSAYSGLNLYNNEKYFNNHIKLLIGFIYTELDGQKLSKNYAYCSCYIRIFKELALRHNLKLDVIKISDSRITNDTQNCIELYRKKRKSEDLLNYYSGWVCYSKEGKQQYLHLATLLDSYGSEFTDEIFQAIANYTLTRKYTSLRGLLSDLICLFNEFTIHCATLEAFKLAIKPENSTVLMLNVFNSLLAKSISQGYCVKDFFYRWSSKTIPLFKVCFIDTGVFEEPLKPFICPIFKGTNRGVKYLGATGGKLTDKEQNRLFSNIPLEIKDEQSIEIIKERVECDIEHIKIVCNKLIEIGKERHERNVLFRRNGIVKQYPYVPSGNARIAYPIGESYLENTVATFYHYNYNHGISNYLNFMNFSGKSKLLIEELNLPTINNLMPILLLLIIEHPKITPSWLKEWELFDKSGNVVGLKETGNQWVAVSNKNRKGVTLAQQEVILTKHSKMIVEYLIEFTAFAREGLKKLGGDDWRFMIITSNLKRPMRNGSSLSWMFRGVAISKFNQSLMVDSYNDKGGEKKLVLSKDSAKCLVPSVSFRNVRKKCGLQVYLQTQSIKAVSEALGHKNPNLELLSSYLPKPIMDFFNARWVRVFQNAIIFEALKESTFLIESLDFSEFQLEEFLNNHRLGKLPSYLDKTNECLVDEEAQIEISQISELVFTLTTPLLQVLIAISVMVEDVSENEELAPILQKWYQSAVFILSHFSLEGRSATYVQGVRESQSMYEAALNSPIDISKFKRRLLCP